MARPYVMWPDKRLRQVASPVAGIDDEVRAIWEEMLSAMYTMPGVGLAAPQLGIMRRLAVVDCSDGADQPLRLANPELIRASTRMETAPEGSPNLSFLSAPVSRPATITLRWLSDEGVREQDFSGLWARSIQHQIDHLNGKLFVDRLGPVKRKMILAKHDKQRRRA